MKIFMGSFIGAVIWENPKYISPNKVTALYPNNDCLLSPFDKQYLFAFSIRFVPPWGSERRPNTWTEWCRRRRLKAGRLRARCFTQLMKRTMCLPNRCYWWGIPCKYKGLIKRTIGLLFRRCFCYLVPLWSETGWRLATYFPEVSISWLYWGTFKVWQHYMT